MISLDTCDILKCYLTEHGSPEVRELVSEADGVTSAAHARVEFVAAVHRHLREGRITQNEMLCIWLVLSTTGSPKSSAATGICFALRSRSALPPRT